MVTEPMRHPNSAADSAKSARLGRGRQPGHDQAGQCVRGQHGTVQVDQVREVAGFLEVGPAGEGGQVLQPQEQLVGPRQAVILLQDGEGFFRRWIPSRMRRRRRGR